MCQALGVTSRFPRAILNLLGSRLCASGSSSEPWGLNDAISQLRSSGSGAKGGVRGEQQESEGEACA